MPSRPVVIVHGYSDRGASAGHWCKRLHKLGYDAKTLHVIEYVSLSNEITIKDIAEGFDRGLRLQAGLTANEEFDAIVHSTGMLVIRAWLTTYASRAQRLKHLIGLAPATFGSPMAHKGRSLLGGIFKGTQKVGPDFMEAGDRVLSGLELGSAFTWDLAHQDFLTENPVYGPHSSTPYPFIFIGLRDYGVLKRIVTEPGTDGTVRWAGAGFNCRKILVDLTREFDEDDPRVRFGKWSNERVPLVLLERHNHGTIFSDPTDDLVESVSQALSVDSADAYRDWCTRHDEVSARSRAAAKAPRWQQFVTRLVDERGDPITDYYFELYTKDNDGRFSELESFNLDYHAFRDDESYRCFHVNLDEEIDIDGNSTKLENLPNLWLRLIASSGSKLVGYHGIGSERMTSTGVPKAQEGKWDAVIDLSSNLMNTPLPPGGAEDVRFFTPFTTTLVEIKMNREPMPLDLQQPNQVTWFLSELPRA
jgi:hypothetical protein